MSNDGTTGRRLERIHTDEGPMRRLLGQPNGVQHGAQRRRRSPVSAVCRPEGVSAQTSESLPLGGSPQSLDARDTNIHPRKAKKESQRRFWCFTSNTAEDPKLVQAIESGLAAFDSSVRYIVFQKERGKDSTHNHFQGYVEFTRGYRLNGVKKRISETAHFEPRRATADKAIAYCKKEDTRVDGPWEFGVRSRGQGARSDLEAFKDAIKGGKRRGDLYEEYPVAMGKYPKFYEGYRLALQKEGWRETNVVLLIGPTGTGKTRWVYDNWKDKGFWRLPLVTTGLWFDTYDGEPYALIDDFTGRISLNSLLQLLDGYWIKVPIKHGFTWWGPTNIAVTTNIEPRLWYKWVHREHQYMCLGRRFSLIMQFDADKTITKYVDWKEYFHEEDIQ